MEEKQIICDSDVIIDLFSPKHKRHVIIKSKLTNWRLNNIVISAITKMEIISGSQNKEHLINLSKRLSDFKITFINHDISELAISLLIKYNLSHGLEIPDSIIAATAIYSDLALFTYNTKDFKFISGLKLVNKI